MGSLSQPTSLTPLSLGTLCLPPSSLSTLGQERAAHRTPAPTLDATPPAASALCLSGSPHHAKGMISPLPGASAQFEHHASRAPASPAHDPHATQMPSGLSPASRCDPCH